MPTYEYRCQDCGNRVEVVQSFSDEPLSVCNVCGGRLRRVFHPVGIVLKGSGFYSTDNRPGKRTATKPKEDSKSEAAKSDSGSSAGKTSSEKSSSGSDSSSSSKKKSDSGGSKAS